MSELGRLEIGEVEAYARLDRFVEAAVHEGGRGVDVLRRHPLGVELAREHRVEAMQSRVHHLPAEHRIRLGVDPLRVDDALDEPRRRAVREPLELGRGEHRLRCEGLEHSRTAQCGLAVERAARAIEPPRPVVRRRKRERPFGVVGRKANQRA